MSHQQNDNFIDTYIDLINENRDNIFNADHRRAMLARYGYTDAQIIKVQDLHESI
jgi:Fe-S cluster biosynthesis and repair protein YggX